MSRSINVLCISRIVTGVFTRLSGRLRGIALALAFATALVGASTAQAQCPAGWVPGIGTTGVSSGVKTLAVLPGGDVVAGGFFATAGSVSANHIARYNPGTGVWSALSSGTNNNVNALAVLPSGEVIVGGNFGVAGGLGTNAIARYTPSTGVWTAVGNVNSGINGGVNALAVLPSGEVIVGGRFINAGGATVNRIARYNPVANSWSPLGSGTDDEVNSLAVLPGGDVIVGGRFTTAGGVPANRIARVNPATGVWSALGTGVSSAVPGAVVFSLAVLPGGDVIAGGYFNTAGSVSVNHIARYNPGTNTWSALGSGVGGVSFPIVNALTVLPSGGVIAGGNFTTAGGLSANRIAQFNPSTGIWSVLGSGISTSDVQALAVLPGGDIVMGGNFTTAGGVSANRIARYSFGTPAPTIATQPVPQSVCPAGSATFSVVPAGTGPFTYQWRKGTVAINTTTNPSASTATLTLSGVGPGDAGSYDCVVSTPCGSVTSTAVALTIASCSCGPSDVAGPGQSIGSDSALTADDIIVFLNWFFAGDTRADVAGPGQSTSPDGQFTADDIIVFLNRFFAGC